MVLIDLSNKNYKFYSRIIKIIKKSNKDIIINSENIEYISDNIKIKNLNTMSKIMKFANKADIIIIFDIDDYEKYENFCEKIFLLYEENSDLNKKINAYRKIKYKNLDYIKELIVVNYKRKRKKINFNFKLLIIIFIIIVSFIILYKQNLILKTLENQNHELNRQNLDLKSVVNNYKNYLFLGDSITNNYNLDEYYKDYKVVNSGICGDQANNIYDNLNKRAYVYNPSTIFLLIGTNDFEHGKTNEEIVKKIEDIIYEINLNLPNAKVYLESIYPVNNTNDEKINKEMVGERDNNRIKDVNKSLKKYCNNKNCTYLDIYDLLKDSDDNLKLEYTSDGLHMSSKGYEKITKELKKYMNKEK